MKDYDFYYDINDLIEFINLLKKPQQHWERPMKKWLSKEISKISQNRAVQDTTSDDFSKINLVTAHHRSLIINYLQSVSAEANSRKDFFIRLKELKETRLQLYNIYSKGVLFRLSHQKSIRIKNKKIAELRQFYLPYLAGVACNLYVTQGLGTETDAKKYFFGK